MFIDQGRFLSHARDVITGFLPGTNHLDRKPVIDETSIALWYSAQPHLCQQFRQHGYGGVILWQSIRPILFCLFLSLFTQFHSTRTLPQVFPMIPQLGGQSKNPFSGRLPEPELCVGINRRSVQLRWNSVQNIRRCGRIFQPWPQLVAGQHHRHPVVDGAHGTIWRCSQDRVAGKTVPLRP